MNKIYKLLKDYCESEGLEIKDIKGDLLEIITVDIPTGKEYTKEDQAHKDLYKFHQHLVQETIDFIKGHQEIRDMIETKKEEIREILGWDPDIEVYFGADGLEESVKSGEWTPYTDSSLEISVGRKSVILSA